jgi:hypothetical protein
LILNRGIDRKGRGRLNLSIGFNRSDGLNGGRAFNGNIRVATRNGYPSCIHGVEELHHAPMGRARACRWRFCHAAAASTLDTTGSGGGGCSPWRRRRRSPATVAAGLDGGDWCPSGRSHAWVWEEGHGAWGGFRKKVSQHKDSCGRVSLQNVLGPLDLHLPGWI